MKATALAALTAITLSSACYATDPKGHPPAVPEALLGGIVQERDVTLVFDYLRDAFRAALEGREAPPPEELVQRAEAVGEEVKRRGVAAGRAILDVIEEKVREGLGEPRRPPPVKPYQRL